MKAGTNRPLIVGDIVRYDDGSTWRVTKVNSMYARIEPMTAEGRHYRFVGKQRDGSSKIVDFRARRKAQNIATTSELEILKEGRQQ